MERKNYGKEIIYLDRERVENKKIKCCRIKLRRRS